jgi:hypothetical protein
MRLPVRGLRRSDVKLCPHRALDGLGRSFVGALTVKYFLRILRKGAEKRVRVTSDRLSVSVPGLPLASFSPTRTPYHWPEEQSASGRKRCQSPTGPTATLMTCFAERQNLGEIEKIPSPPSSHFAQLLTLARRSAKLLSLQKFGVLSALPSGQYLCWRALQALDSLSSFV